MHCEGATALKTNVKRVSCLKDLNLKIKIYWKAVNALERADQKLRERLQKLYTLRDQLERKTKLAA